MTITLLILAFALLLTIGHGNVVFSALKQGEAGWFGFQYSRKTNPRAFWVLMVIELSLLAGLVAYCFRLFGELMT